jgi:hypothetical protein
MTPKTGGETTILFERVARFGYKDGVNYVC